MDDDRRLSLDLTDFEDADGRMRRTVHLTSDGRLVVEGHDLGDTEYEFERTLGVADTARLAHLLGVPLSELLTAIQQRFGSTHLLEGYLEEQAIVSEFWSRIGE